MRKRGDRSIKQLYDQTEMISNPEITPVLEGSCRIQGPGDESDHKLQPMNLGTDLVEKRYKVSNESFRTRPESGTCNVCSAPCASCLHFNRTMSAMESNVEGNYTINNLKREEADCCSFNGGDTLPQCKVRACDDLQQEASETSNLQSVGSTHESYSENAESKVSLAVNASEDVDMSQTMMSGEAVGGPGFLSKDSSVSACRLLSSSCNASSDLQQSLSTSQNEDQRKLECHDDNVSCLTGGRDALSVNVLNVEVDRKESTHAEASTMNFPANRIEKEPEGEACHVSGDCEVKEGEIKFPGSSACLAELQKKSSGPRIANVGFSNAAGTLHVSSMTKRDSSKGEPSEFVKDADKTLSGPLISGNIEGQNQKASLNKQDTEACQILSGSSSGGQKSDYLRLETEMSQETRMMSNDVLETDNCIATNIVSDKSCTLMETSKIQGSENRHQHTSEGENSDTDIEDDVKVCDICGDAGREECLAVCSRCSDGAEHTYCMRIMMEKVPEGDWLCEECKLKEDAENQKVDTADMFPGPAKVHSMKEKVEISESAFKPKASPRLDTRLIETEVKGKATGIPCPLSSRRHNDTTELLGKRLCESDSGAIETASPRKRVALARESSFKNPNAGKAKPASLAISSGNHSMNISQTSLRTQTPTGSSASKTPSQLQALRASLSRSYSSNSSGLKGKVKQLTESIHHTPKATRELLSRDTRKDGPIKTLTKNLSFRSVGQGRTTGESLNKNQCLNSPKADDPRSLKLLKERNSLERKSSFKLDRTFTSPSSTMNTGMPSSKTELNVAQLPGKSNIKSEPNFLGGSRVLEDTNGIGCHEVKKQASYPQKSFGSSSYGSSSEGQKASIFPSKEGIRSTIDRSTIQSDAVLQRSLPQPAESTLRDDKAKDSNFFSSSRQSLSAGRASRCQRCNETGHATQFCSIDKLRCSALKPSAERNLKEGTSKSNKSKDAAEALVSKSKVQTNSRLLEQPEESKLLLVDLSCGLDSKETQVTLSASEKKFAVLGDTTEQSESLRNSILPSKAEVASDVKQQDVHEVKTCISGTREANVSDVKQQDVHEVKTCISGTREANVSAVKQQDVHEVKTCISGTREANVSDVKQQDVHEVKTCTSGTREANVSDVKQQDVHEVKTCISGTREANVSDVKHQDVHELKACIPGSQETNISITDSVALTVKPLLQPLPKCASVPENHPLRVAAIPEFDFIWQGDFEVLRTDRLPEPSYGFQAHLSSCASPKVLEAATKLPAKVKLEEVPRLSSWPLQFQRTNPKDENIALFFFAKDIESYENNYTKLLEDMLKNDLALKGVVDGVELLIFPSNKLPENSQRWNNLFFLWGVFRERNPDCIEMQTCHKELSKSSFDVEHLAQASPLSVGPTSQEKNLQENPKKNLTKFERSMSTCQMVASQLGQASSKPMDQPHELMNSRPDSGIQMNAAQFFSEQKNEAACLKIVGSEFEGGGASEPPTDVQLNSGNCDLPPALPIDCALKAGKEGIHVEHSIKEDKESEKLVLVKSEHVVESGHAQFLAVTNQLSWESNVSRKRGRLCSVDATSQASGETSRSAGEAMLGNENVNSTCGNNQQEHKKMKLSSEGHAGSSSCKEDCVSGRLSSKVHPLLPSFSNEQQHKDIIYDEPMMAESSKGAARRHFFPVDLNSVADDETEHVIHVLSSDDEDAPESNIPDLELALGGRKTPTKQEMLPLFMPLADRSSKRKHPTATDNDDDSSASLSLSLAFPFSERKEHKASSTGIPKRELRLPDSHHVNTSLLLFGGRSKET